MMLTETLGARLLGVFGCVALLAAVSGARADGAVAPYTVADGGIAAPLTDKPRDAAKGKALVIDREKGGCLACHVMPVPEEPIHGLIGPSLLGVADRMTESQLRLRIVDSKAINPDTIMPAFHRVTGLHRVLEAWQGTPFLTAQEVEDVVSYLKTLKEDHEVARQDHVIVWERK